MVRRVGNDQVGDMAASVAYYTLFSLFPLLLGLIAVSSLFLDQVRVERELLNLTSQYIPGAEGLIRENIDEVFRIRGALGLIAVVGLLWSASAVFGGITRVLDRAWNVSEAHPFHLVRLRSIAMVAGVAGLFALSFLSSTALQTAEGLADLDPLGLGGFLASGARAFLQGSSLFGSLAFPALLYRFAPSDRIPWKDVLPAALLAGIVFEIAKNIFLLYLSRFAQLDRVYGSLSLVIALLLWAYISSLILILGAEFGAALGRWRRGDTQRVIRARALGRG
jgi:membrane protein